MPDEVIDYLELPGRGTEDDDPFIYPARQTRDPLKFYTMAYNDRTASVRAYNQNSRDTVGEDSIVGVTCHDSRHLAMEAAERGATYVAFGAFHPTATKAAKSSASLETLEWWRDLFVVPCVAIGGINVENCGALVKAGADFVAVVSAVWDHPEGPGRAVALFNRAGVHRHPQSQRFQPFRAEAGAA